MHAVLSGERLRDRSRRRWDAAAADQRVELRALQDVRHHGPVRRDYLGAAGGGRRSSIQWDVSSTTKVTKIAKVTNPRFVVYDCRLAIIPIQALPGGRDCRPRLSADQPARPDASLACRRAGALRCRPGLRAPAGDGV